jgi:hypothetical protein
MPDDSAAMQIQRLRPERVETVDRVPDFLDRFVRDITIRPTHESSKLSLVTDDSEPRVTGWVHYPAVLTALEGLLRRTAISSTSLEVLVTPVPRLEVERPLFDSSETPLTGRADSNPESAVVHIWEPGSPIRPLHRTEGAVLCQSETGYLGWVREEEFEVRSNGGDVPKDRESGIDATRLEEIAKAWIGTPYVWGGSGASGIDCSGFTQAVYKDLGILLPRDANQQMLGGRIVATHDRWEPLRAGDLLFFTQEDGRIGHVGISLGGYCVIHAERPAVSIFSLDPESSDFNPLRNRHFAFAKRYLI